MKSLPAFSLPFLLSAVSLFGYPEPIGIDLVPAGSPGNPDQGPGNRQHGNDAFDGTGSVDYEFYVGTYEVTNAQYVEFLEAVAARDPNGLFHSSMQSSSSGGISRTGSPGSYDYAVRGDRGDWPVNFVGILDAARFANWLTNGKPLGSQTAGTTETGTYDLTDPANLPPGGKLTRNEDAWENGGVAIPTLDEWFKAAFYDPDPNRYFFYATGSDQDPDATAPNDSNPNSANYHGSSNLGRPTPVGGYSKASSPFGTFDQSGNLWEWTETSLGNTIFYVMGGSFNYLEASSVGASRQIVGSYDKEERSQGFRIARMLPSNPPVQAFTGFGEVIVMPQDNRFLSDAFGDLAIDPGGDTAFSESLQADLAVQGGSVRSPLYGLLAPTGIRGWVDSEFHGRIHFGDFLPTYAGWVHSERFGWMRFVEDGGDAYLWVHRLQTWLAVNPDGSFVSFDFGPLSPVPGTLDRYDTGIGRVTADETTPEGWLESDRFGFVWFARDGSGTWFWSESRNEWLGITPEGGIWSTAEERFL